MTGAGDDVIEHRCLCDRILRVIGIGLAVLIGVAIFGYVGLALGVAVWQGGGVGLAAAGVLVVFCVLCAFLVAVVTL